MLRSFGGIGQMSRESFMRSQGLRLARLAGGNLVGTNTAGVYADMARRIVPESLRPGLPGLISNLASMGYSSRPQFDVLRYGKMFGNLGLSSSVAQAFEAHRLASPYSEGWRLQAMRFTRTTALQSILRSSTTLGPIVVEPDYEDDTPYDYHPDLQWLFPETATESEDAVVVEETWAKVVAVAQGIAVHHRTKALLSVMLNGREFLIRVCNHPKVAQAIEGAISARIGYEVGGAAGAVIGGAGGPLIAYVLKRR
jgi:hypothetical protein